MRNLASLLALSLVAATFTETVQAQGYVLDELSARRLGDAFSGGAAEARDASTVYYNPAGLARLTEADFVAGVSMLNNHIDFHGHADSATPGFNGGITPVAGDSAFDYRSHDLVPNIYYATPVESGMLEHRGVVGVAFNVPIASTTEFPANGVTRYQNLESSLVGMRLTLSFAQPITDQLSVGGGFALQQLEAENRTAVDTFVVCEQVGFLNCDAYYNAGHDGNLDINADALDWGYTLGVLYQFDDATRAGVAYRSRIEHDMEGDFVLDVPIRLGGSDIHLDVPAQLSMSSPENLSLSVFHALTPRLSVQADATWTGWSVFEQLWIETNAGLDVIQPQHWRDTWRLAVGGEYQLSDALAVRAGLASDPSPIPAQYRSLGFPMDDYRALSCGVSYAFTPKLSVEAALQRTAAFSSKVRDGDLATQGGESNGTADVSTWSLAVGLASRF